MSGPQRLSLVLLATAAWACGDTVIGENGPFDPSCQPVTCASAGKNCGEMDDGCGAPIQCGDCAGVETCGGSGLANVCGIFDPAWAAWPMPDSLTNECGLGYSRIICPEEGQPGYGQDSSYMVNWPDYETSVDTVLDTITGLTWERSPPEVERDWQEARTYCESLVLGGYSNWRLPKTVEVVSIMDPANGTYLLNPVVFQSQNPFGGLWTSSSYSSGVYIRVPVAGGTFAWDSAFMYTRCVRSEQDPGFDTVLTGLGGLEDQGMGPGAPAGRYGLNPDTVEDKVTGLTWQRQAPSVKYTWADALTYCEQLELAGAGDWRLPSFKELWTIIDERPADLAPPVDVVAFPDQTHEAFWTSTYHVPDPQFEAPGGRLISFGFGGGPGGTQSDANGIVDEYSVRCVR